MLHKFRNIAVLTFAIISLVSCKNEKNSDEEVKEPELKNFTITVNAIVQEKDDFQIFYNETNSPEFKDDDSKIVSFVGLPEAQNIVFEFPKYTNPINLRFDVGANPEQKPVVVNFLKFEYLDRSFEIKGAEFGQYFYSANQVEIDDQTQTFKIVYKEGEVYDPILLGNENLKLKLESLYIENKQ